MIDTMELCPGVTLRCRQESRFKQGALSIQLVRPMCQAEAALNALLPAVLLRGTESCADLRSITQRLDELYGASVSTLVRRIGDYQTTGLYCGFMEDKYALPGDRVLEPMAAFLGELLLRPALEHGIFRQDYVESERKNLISTIEAERNDKRAYCAAQMLKTMCKADSYGIPRLGDKEAVAAITPEALYAHYQRILRESRVEIFYVGSAGIKAVAALMKKVLGEQNRNYVNLPPQTPFNDQGGNDQTEEMEITQGKLSMGFVTPITNQSPQFASMQLFNTIFGAGMTSKLFMNVREKMSLCYAIGSGYYGSKGILTVSAGIDCQQEPVVRREILRQLEACQNGEISGEELAAAKEAVLSSLRSVHDSPGSIEGFYATAALSGLGRMPDVYMAEVAAVTAADVVAAAKTVRLHTTYFLKGVSA